MVFMEKSKSRGYESCLEGVKKLQEENLLIVVGRAFAIASRQAAKDMQVMKRSGRKEPRVDIMTAFAFQIKTALGRPLNHSSLEKEAEKYGLPSSMYMAQDAILKNVRAAGDIAHLETPQLYALCFRGYENAGNLIAQALTDVEPENIPGTIRSKLANWYRENYTW